MIRPGPPARLRWAAGGLAAETRARAGPRAAPSRHRRRCQSQQVRGTVSKVLGHAVVVAIICGRETLLVEAWAAVPGAVDRLCVDRPRVIRMRAHEGLALRGPVPGARLEPARLVSDREHEQAAGIACVEAL